MHLMLISPLPVPRNLKGEYGFDPKTISGIRAYASRWDGQTTLVAPPADITGDTSNLVWIDSHLEEFNVIVDSAFPQEVVVEQPDVAFALHRFGDDSEALVRSEVPLVFTTEVSLGIRLDIMRSVATGLTSRAKSEAGLYRRELSMRSMARRAEGIQCNGFAAWKAYSRLNQNPMFFHDHRITSTDIKAANSGVVWDGRRPLRLGFSGRITKIKGPQYFVQLASMLESMHPDIRLHIMGGGDLESEIRKKAPSNLVFDGSLDFETEWKKHVRSNIDLMVLPHIQGDPSCTYFESLGCGVPILGFHNETLSPLVRKHAVGWAVPRGNVAALANVVTSIVDNPSALTEARIKGLKFMTEHDYESTVDRRVAHLKMVANASQT